MEGSLAIKILVGIAAVSATHLLVLRFCEDRRMKALAGWLQRTYPQHWERLPWSVRTLRRPSAVEAFHKEESFYDPEFERRYREAKATRRQQERAAIVAALAAGLAFLGTRLFGWSW